jgi:polysaccharide biosynthesis protein PslJ
MSVAPAESRAKLRRPEPTAGWAGSTSRVLPADEGDWPHTRRLLPWMLAGFLVMLWLTPFNRIDLPFQLPVDAKLDRFGLAFIAIFWLATIAAAGLPNRRSGPNLVGRAALVFVAIAVASVVTHAELLANLNELQVAYKKLALLLAYLTFFYIVATVVRPGELWAFATLVVVLASITAIGTVYEYRADFNAFYEWTGRLLPDSLRLAGEPGRPTPYERPAVTGPTDHGLAVATILVLAMPFALLGVIRSTETRDKVLYGAATGLIFAGAVATLRKTSVLIPVAPMLVLLAYRPREMIRLLPLGVVLIVMVQALAPGALGSIRSQLFSGGLFNQISVKGRTSDYDAVEPDVKSRPVLGRGYGSYEAAKYRLLDNQYLGVLIGTGFLGFAAFVGVWIATIGVAGRAARSRNSYRGLPALAITATAAAFGTAAALFDVMAFPHVPYLFLLCAGMAVVVAVGEGDLTMRRRRLPLST